jgi:exosome complex component RRP41
VEAATALQQSLEAAVMLRQYPGSEIVVHVQVLQSDGGALTAAINAATLALIDAGVAMRDFVVGCSVAYIQRTALLGASSRRRRTRRARACVRRVTIRVRPPACTPPACADPNHLEASSGGAELAVAALPRSGKVTLATMDARMPLDALEVRPGARVGSQPIAGHR